MCVSNNRCPIWTFCNWIPVIGYPRDLHVNYKYFNGFFLAMFRTVLNTYESITDVLAQKNFPKDFF